MRLQRATETQSATTGEITKVWTALATVWASVEPLTGREYFTAQQVQAEVTHKITMRKYTGMTLTPKDRILFGSRVFGVEAIIDVEERGREWNAMCREEVA